MLSTILQRPRSCRSFHHPLLYLVRPMTPSEKLSETSILPSSMVVFAIHSRVGFSLHSRAEPSSLTPLTSFLRVVCDRTLVALEHLARSLNSLCHPTSLTAFSTGFTHSSFPTTSASVPAVVFLLKNGSILLDE